MTSTMSCGCARSDANHVDVIALAADSRADVDALSRAMCRQPDATIIHSPRELTTPGGGYGFRFFSPDGLPFEISSDVARGPKRELERWEGIPVKHQPHRAAFAGPSGSGEVLHRRAGLSRQRLAGRFHVLPALQFRASPHCHPAGPALPEPCCLRHADVDGMMRGISRLKHKVSTSMGPGPPHGWQQHLQLFRLTGWLRHGIYRGTRRRRLRKHEAQVQEPEPTVMDQWGIGSGGPQALPKPAPNPGLFEAANA